MAENRSSNKGSSKVVRGLKIVGAIGLAIGVLFLIALASGVVNFGAEALHETRRVLSVKNIREQEEAIVEDWQNLLVATGNACNAVSSKPDANSPTLVEDPAMAYAATARKETIDYNSRQNTLFKAREVGPKGYPKYVPDGKAMNGAKPDWCAISEDLRNTHD